MEAGRFVNLCGSTLIAVGTAEFSVCVQVYVCIHTCKPVQVRVRVCFMEFCPRLHGSVI